MASEPKGEAVAPFPSRVQGSARAAAFKQHYPNGSEAVDNAVRDLCEIALQEHIERVVGQAPPLTDQQKARLAALFQAGGE